MRPLFYTPPTPRGYFQGWGAQDLAAPPPKRTLTEYCLAITTYDPAFLNAKSFSENWCCELRFYGLLNCQVHN